MCEFLQDTHVMPGYICCQCRTYNGLQRTACKICGAAPHPLMVPDDVLTCSECGAGYPKELPRICLACGTTLGGTADIRQLGADDTFNIAIASGFEE